MVRLILSAVVFAALLMAIAHPRVHPLSRFFFSVAAFGVILLAVAEMFDMYTRHPEWFVR